MYHDNKEAAPSVQTVENCAVAARSSMATMHQSNCSPSSRATISHRQQPTVSSPRRHPMRMVAVLATGSAATSCWTHSLDCTVDHHQDVSTAVLAIYTDIPLTYFGCSVPRPRSAASMSGYNQWKIWGLSREQSVEGPTGHRWKVHARQWPLCGSQSVWSRGGR